MTPLEFIKKWKPVALTERATAQSHFNDLCVLLGHDDPIKADPTGDWFTFEKGVPKTGAAMALPTCGRRASSPGNTKKRNGTSTKPSPSSYATLRR
jgi:hypothetical protein